MRRKAKSFAGALGLCPCQAVQASWTHHQTPKDDPWSFAQRGTKKVAFRKKKGKELETLQMWLERATRIHTQKRKDKDKLYALHAPEDECIGKCKARKPFEFSVKSGIAVTHKQGLIVGARSFPGNPWDGHTLSEQIEQATILLEAVNVTPKQVVVEKKTSR